MMDTGHLGELSLADLRYLENRVARLRRLLRDHLRWEHELSMGDGGAFELPCDDAHGQWHVTVIDSVFLDIHRKLITSLIADFAAYGPHGQTLSERVFREQLQAFEDELIR